MIPIIIACEIGFWVFVLAGLVCRYIFRLPKTGMALFFCTPVIDVVLLIVTVLHLRSGAEATYAHGLAAVYIGVSLVFGHAMIKGADVRFAHRFAGGPPPQKTAVYGKEHASRERRSWFRHFAAWAVGCTLLYGMILMVNAADRTEEVKQVIQLWSIIVAVDFAISFSYTLWPRKYKRPQDAL
ncbi:hypothetical protein [Paenibacillus sp. y28]|uniref:hypothetical protein n=1 Tax=Paenibacillus sp. y28 TaxID=3129110 RepID=UPI003018E098